MAGKTRIGIDFHYAEREGTGNCTYMRNLVESVVAMDEERSYLLYVTQPDHPYYARFRSRKNVTLQAIAGSSAPARMLGLARATFRDRPHILHVNYYAPPFYRGKLVVTVHDISYHHLPDCFPFRERLKNELLIPFFLRRAARVLTVSEYSRQDMVAVYGAAPEKIVVGYNGVNPLFRPLENRREAAEILAPYGIGEDFLLYIGRLNRRKNLQVLIAAFNDFKRRGTHPHRLVIVGRRDFLPAEDMATIDASPYRDDVIFTGYVPDGHLPLLYGTAALFVYPSLFEGFGLPCLEAMACGCPVVTSNTTSLPEVVGDAAIMVNPNDHREICAAIEEVLTDADRRREMIGRGLARAGEFTWQRTAAKFLEIVAVLSR
ncbi:MAG TPA: glycosyltransferase family 1 protein [Syntrophales bacterium]|jgi:glycosyltransferase involved in cell wall biosynthesis|nr:glycosyltransferase family 1 protein [Syntrophales bacterium]HPC32594.1 glycosyltransferase family 1 protein [Syntrophales bacterium]HQG34209.1 glycosyltransferase family 1 protein [Syntrophales bacterium]HQI35554.1 glycosyltransferase family 1 protein [Syntrophales bacterium]HQJ30581.1 glycosyltransferase family 1 protein [Syntrophales bacterium]